MEMLNTFLDEDDDEQSQAWFQTKRSKKIRKRHRDKQHCVNLESMRQARELQETLILQMVKVSDNPIITQWITDNIQYQQLTKSESETNENSHNIIKSSIPLLDDIDQFFQS